MSEVQQQWFDMAWQAVVRKAALDPGVLEYACCEAVLAEYLRLKSLAQAQALDAAFARMGQFQRAERHP